MFTHAEHAGDGVRGGGGRRCSQWGGGVGGGESGEDFKLQISQILQTFLQILYM